MDASLPVDPPGQSEPPAAGYGRSRGPDVCPHLRSQEGPWRIQHPSRDHRCALLARDAALDTVHQRRYCLTEHHPNCPINVPPAEAASRRLEDAPPDRGGWRSVPASPPALRRPLGTAVAGRPWWPLVAVFLAGAAALVFLFLWGPFSGSAQPSAPAGGAGASATPGGASLRPSAEPTPGGTDEATPGPSADATAKPPTTPAPTKKAGRTYTVKKGDTLSEIAATFGVTVAALMKENKITDAKTLRVGQVLKIP